MLTHCDVSEMERLIETYPRSLERRESLDRNPPLITYVDWSLGPWPTAVVARFRPETVDEPGECVARLPTALAEVKLGTP